MSKAWGGRSVMLVGTLGLILSVAGWVGIWWLHHRGGAALDRFTQRKSDVVTLVGQQIERSATNLGLLATRIASFPPELAAFLQAKQDDPVARVSELVAWAFQFEERRIRLESHLDALQARMDRFDQLFDLTDSVPGLEETTDLARFRVTTAVQNVRMNAEELSDEFKALGDSLRELREPGAGRQRAQDRLTGVCAQLDQQLNTLRQQVASVRDDLELVATKVDEATQKVRLWWGVSALVAAIFVLWFAVGQLALILYGRAILKALRASAL